MASFRDNNICFAICLLREGFSFKKWLLESGWPPYFPDLTAGDVLMKPVQDLAKQWIEYGRKV